VSDQDGLDEFAPFQQTLADLLAALRREAGLTQQQLADRLGYARATVAGAETGQRSPGKAFWVSCDDLLAPAGQLRAAYAQLTAARKDRAERAARQSEAEREARVARWRAAASLPVDPAGIAPAATTGYPTDPTDPTAQGDLLGSVLPLGEADEPAAEDVTGVLLRRWLHDDDPAPREVPSLARLRSAVHAAKRTYQACGYSQVRRTLPGLLDALAAAAVANAGDDRRSVWALTAQAYHVAASVELKAGSEGPAWLAADRSMQAAERSEDPVVVASSARILTHALTAAGHCGLATTLTRRATSRLASAYATPPADALSVYGALLLRGAIAAAQQPDRAAALELLDEAHEAAQRLGGDFNHAFSGFGPANVLLHRVHLAVVLGDAGTAIDHARRVELSTIDLAERRACLFIDIARAWSQQGRHDRACHALRAAYTIAPEELTARRTVRALVAETLLNAPPSTRRDARDLAERVGAG
jgi:transcriptional regulator with XRE-family HTH domain